jgi:large subunit ribosomal protein L52
MFRQRYVNRRSVKTINTFFFVALVMRLCNSKRLLATTSTNHFNQKWRQERGLPLNPNASGPLTDGPDYSFLDGRPTPYTVGQKNRVLKHQQLVESIIKLTGEVDFAVTRHAKLQQQEQAAKQKVLDSKLKPKGIELLKKKT